MIFFFDPALLFLYLGQMKVRFSPDFFDLFYGFLIQGQTLHDLRSSFV